MKLRKIKWNKHPILGDLALDFINHKTGEPYSTILLAGENGTGKSTILEAISSFLNLGPYESFDYIEYAIGDNIYKTAEPTDGTTHKPFFDIVDQGGNIQRIRHDRNNNPGLITSETNDLRHYGCVYSKARSDYKTQKITSTTTSELDKNKHDIDVTEDFTSLKQLIVDVVNQDNAGYSEVNKALGSNPRSWDEFYQTSKLFRFKSAFDSFFEKMKYEKVDDMDGEKTILFSKNGKLIPVDDLSTGEKQIVFRGIFLLKNTNILDGAAIMIDEPELSMHPKWERKILGYYKSLFSLSGQQKAQLIFATHSDHVLKEALIDKVNSIVVTLEETNGVIACRNIDAPSVLPSITTAETTYLAFDVVSNDYHIELYGWLQDKESVGAVKACDDFIKMHPSYDSLRHGKPSSHGKTTYETLSTYIRNSIHHPDSGNTFTESELRASIELLTEICK
ncbi:AAA family ATPase [Pseudomonas lundensis]|uniref:AAA family ATPase n=1 Tax=Pseudomonas lundensis TaxID=86185 RepID=UPI00193B1A36|nr:ATP-binding protein [Pseudomonas lundensis]MBM1185308.1 ATP-binding protein [Pseudomonas lundensis]